MAGACRLSPDHREGVRLVTNVGWFIHRLPCWMKRHRWRYFIDGNISRACETCRTVEYDLPWASVHATNRRGSR